MEFDPPTNVERVPQATEAAIATADALARVPLYDGGIQVELHAGGYDIEIDIGPDGKIRSCLFATAEPPDGD